MQIKCTCVWVKYFHVVTFPASEIVREPWKPRLGHTHSKAVISCDPWTKMFYTYAFTADIPTESEALPGVLGERGIRSFISGEQGNKSLKLTGKGEQRQFGGTGNIENQDFDFGEQGNADFFQMNKRIQPPHPTPPTSPPRPPTPRAHGRASRVDLSSASSLKIQHMRL